MDNKPVTINSEILATQEYNGWVNKETWLMSLWLEEAYPNGMFWLGGFDNKAEELKHRVKLLGVDFFFKTGDKLIRGMYFDMWEMSLTHVDWQKLIEFFGFGE